MSSLSLELTLPQLLEQHPEARAVFDRYGLRGCGGKLGPVESLRFFAHTHGVPEGQLLSELAEVIAHPEKAEPVLAPTLADAIYKPFFLAGIAVVLTLGASWGAYILWQIGLNGSFFSASLQAINAHGHAQIYGWVGLFIMGFSLQSFPRMWHTDLWRPRLAVAALVLLLAGLALRTVGMILQDHALGLALAMSGGAGEVAAVLLYITVVLRTFLRSSSARQDWRAQPYLGFAFASLFYFAVSSLMDVWHLWNTMTAGSPSQLVWFVSAYQAPLRDLQVHGLALCMILGVSLRMLPPLFELPAVPAARGWWAFALVNAGVIGEVAAFIAWRLTGNHLFAPLLLAAWLVLIAGIALVALPWKPWRPMPAADRSGKFVRAGFAWLALSLLMLLLLPAYSALSGIPFSHAYYGAIRHAITVGFVSLMIMGMAAKVVPTLNGLDTRQLTGLWAPFLLVNLGCFLRVSMQTLTDWHPVFFSYVGISGVLEISGLALWGGSLAAIMLRGEQAAAQPVEESARPESITGDLTVAEVLKWFPETEEIFVFFGFTMLQNPILRRTLARQVSVAQACSMRNISLPELLQALNAVTGLPPGPLMESESGACPPANCSACAHACHSQGGDW